MRMTPPTSGRPPIAAIRVFLRKNPGAKIQTRRVDGRTKYTIVKARPTGPLADLNRRAPAPLSQAPRRGLRGRGAEAMSATGRYVFATTSDYVTLRFGGGIVGQMVNQGHRYLETDAVVKQHPQLFRPVTPTVEKAA